MFRGLGASALAVLLSAAAATAHLDQSSLVFPRIQGAGGIAVLPKAPYQPKSGTRVIFDIAVASKPAELNKGLERIARLINLHAGHGVPDNGLQIVAVLHGHSTDAALSDHAYKLRTGVDENPNLPLLRQLKESGVRLYVCGQSLAQKKYAHEEVAAPLEVAVSAMLVNVQSQADGFAVMTVY